MLPAVIPQARIFTYHHDARWLANAPVQTLPDVAHRMLVVLDNRRREASSLECRTDDGW